MYRWESKAEGRDDKNMTVEKMLEYVYELPRQFEYSLEMNFDFIVSRYEGAYKNIMISGLGGSAIGGDILRTYSLQKAGIPVLVNRDYDVPQFVSRNTLFFAVSYSGNTEETLSSYQQALDKGASIICVTSGGKLAVMAEKDGHAVVRIPAGLVPRAATGYLFAPIALILDKMGILQGVEKDVEETIDVLKNLRETLNPGVDVPANQAKVIAGAMKNSIPVIWGSVGSSETAAMRWKAQINENAKSPAYYNVFPELNHNEIVGFEVPPEFLANFTVIVLKDSHDSERIKRRMEISRGIIQNRVKDVIEVNSTGESFLARFYSLAYVGDYASVYLAMEYGLNPTPVKVIDYLKAELAKAGP